MEDPPNTDPPTHTVQHALQGNHSLQHTLQCNIDLGFVKGVKTLIPPVLFTITLLALVKTDCKEYELYYPLGAFSFLCVWNNFR